VIKEVWQDFLEAPTALPFAISFDGGMVVISAGLDRGECSVHDIYNDHDPIHFAIVKKR